MKYFVTSSLLLLFSLAAVLHAAPVIPKGAEPPLPPAGAEEKAPPASTKAVESPQQAQAPAAPASAPDAAPPGDGKPAGAAPEAPKAPAPAEDTKAPVEEAKAPVEAAQAPVDPAKAPVDAPVAAGNDAAAAAVEAAAAAKAAGLEAIPDDLDEDELLPSLEDLYSDESVEWDDYTDEDKDQLKHRDEEFNEEYQRYLDEMAQEMLADPKMRDEIIRDLEGLSAIDLEKEDTDLLLIARRLQAEEHRTQLDEQERIAVDRQRRFGKRAKEAELDVNRKAADFNFGDGDEKLWDEKEKNAAAMQKINHQRKNVLNHIDQDRARAFKQHMMERELKFRETLKQITDDKERARLEAAHKHSMDRLRAARGHAPGGKKQLEEVWELEDGFADEHFDAKVFFRMHDASQDGFWDIKELEAIFYRAAVKLHTDDDVDSNEIDLPAVREEMALMRGKVLHKADMNADGLVSEEEFIQLTKQDDFETDEAWDPLVPDFTEEELNAFHKKRLRALNDARHKEHLNKAVEKVGRAVEKKIIKEALNVNMKAVNKVKAAANAAGEKPPVPAKVN